MALELEEAVEKAAGKIKDSITEKFQKRIEDNSKDIKDLLAKAEEIAKDRGDLSEVKNQLTNALEKWNSEKEGMQKHLDAMDVKLQKSTFGNPENKDSFENTLIKGLDENVEKLKAKKSGIGNLDFSVKLNSGLYTKATMSTATNFGGVSAVAPDSQAGIVGIPPQARVRNLVPGATTNSNAVRYVRYTGKTGAAAAVGEGGLKPEMELNFQVVDALVKKIAVTLRIPEEMLEDIPWLTSYIAAEAREEVKQEEDAQILKGDGLGNNLSGIVTVADAFAAGDLTDTIPNGYSTFIDAIRAAANQVKLSKFPATGIVVHPTAVTKMRMQKETTTTRKSLIPETINSAVPMIDGIPVVENSEMGVDEFLVGNFQLGAQLIDRQQTNIRFYDQDRDNAVLNLITVVVEERLALAVKRTNVFSYGTFAAAKTALETL